MTHIDKERRYLAGDPTETSTAKKLQGTHAGEKRHGSTVIAAASKPLQGTRLGEIRKGSNLTSDGAPSPHTC